MIFENNMFDVKLNYKKQNISSLYIISGNWMAMIWDLNYFNMNIVSRKYNLDKCLNGVMNIF